MSEVQAAEISVSKPAAYPLEVRIVCLLMGFVNRIARRKDGSFNRWLTNWLEYKIPAKNTPTRGVYTKDVVIDTETGVWVRLFLPVEGDSKLPEEARKKEALGSNFPVVLYFHGGGFTSFSPHFLLYDIFCRRLARRCRVRCRVIVISVDYRRSPEYRYPIPCDDCFRAITWLCSGGGRPHLPVNADLSRCFLMGDSAGGNLVHHVGCRVSAEKDITMKGLRIVGHILLQPFFGGEERTPSELRLQRAPIVNINNSDWHWKAFLPVGANRDHPACNVVGPNAPGISALPLPPTLVVVGGHDALQDWQRRYVENLRNINKHVELLFQDEGIHDFFVFFNLQISSRLISDLNSFMIKCQSGK